MLPWPSPEPPVGTTREFYPWWHWDKVPPSLLPCQLQNAHTGDIARLQGSCEHSWDSCGWTDSHRSSRCWWRLGQFGGTLGAVLGAVLGGTRCCAIPGTLLAPFLPYLWPSGQQVCSVGIFHVQQKEDSQKGIYSFYFKHLAWLGTPAEAGAGSLGRAGLALFLAQNWFCFTPEPL